MSTDETQFDPYEAETPELRRKYDELISCLPPQFRKDMEEMQRNLMRLAHKAAGLLVFHHLDNNGSAVLTNGSFFIVQEHSSYFLVTAKHVYEEYSRSRELLEYTYCHLGGHCDKFLLVDLVDRLISVGDSLDIATCSLTSDDVIALNMDCVINIHAVPTENESIVLCGYPGHGRNVAINGGWGAAAHSGIVATVTSTALIIPQSFDRCITLSGQILPQEKSDAGGMSGGPVLVRRTVEGAPKWVLCGVISQGNREFDTLYIQRTDFIQPDGTITEVA